MNKRAKRIFLFFLNFNPLSSIRLERNHFEQANISRVGRGDVVHRARLADISAVYTSLRPTSSLSPLNAPPIPRLKENFFAAHASFAERKERGGWRETPLNLRRSWRFERVGGWGERRHLWFAQFPRTFRPSTTKRDFALWLCSPFLLGTFPKIPRPYQSFRRPSERFSQKSLLLRIL